MGRLAAALIVLAASIACGEGPRSVALGAAPADWYVMGFPRRPVTVDGPGGKPFVIDRAVPISVAELRAGTVAVDLGGAATAPVEIAQLYFLPGADGDRQLEAWRKTLPWHGFTDGTWAAANADGELYRIELRLRADGREEAHVYFATSDEIRSFEEPRAR